MFKDAKMEAKSPSKTKILYLHQRKKINMEKILSEINEANQKLLKSYDTLKSIDDVEIAQSPKTEVYAEDKLRLFHYDRETPATVKTPIIIIYALVNTYKMLDLQPDRSYIKSMLENGFDVYLIDWGYPSHTDKYLSIDDYVNGYINNCVDVIRKRNRTDKVNIIRLKPTNHATN